MVKTYFIAPNLSIAPPPKGPVKLGHIIMGPNEADIEPLNVLGHIEAPNVSSENYQQGFTDTRKKLLSGEIGIWAKIAASFGVKASAAHRQDSEDLIEVQSLQTITFQPDMAYVQRSMAAPEVMAFVTASKYQVPVYMITGFKVAKGASVEKKRSRTSLLSGAATFPVTGVEIGPKIQIDHSTVTSEGFKSSTDFVLAFRVRKVQFRGGKVEHKLHTRGAQMMDDEAGLSTSGSQIEVGGLEDGAGMTDPEWELIGNVEGEPGMNDCQVLGVRSAH